MLDERCFHEIRGGSGVSDKENEGAGKQGVLRSLEGVQATDDLGLTWCVPSELLQASLQLLGHRVAQLLQAQFAGGLGHQAAGLASFREEVAFEHLPVEFENGRSEVVMGGGEFIFPASAEGLSRLALTSQSQELPLLIGVDAVLKRVPFQDEGVGDLLQFGFGVAGLALGPGDLSPGCHKIRAIFRLA